MPKVISLIRNRDITGDEYTVLLSLISPDKRAVAENRRNRQAAQNSLLGDILVRRELCHLTGLRNRDLRFAANEHQKPFLEDWPDIHYNLSHSGNGIVAAFDSNPIGIDIEIIRPVNYRITRKVFSLEEQNHFEMLPERERLLYFYTIWTMKEAYLKKDGAGLSRLMSSFDAFSLPNEQFFPVPLGKQAVCHICTSRNKAPPYIQETVDDLMDDLASELHSNLVTGEKGLDDASWNGYIADLKRMGLDEVISIWQARINRGGRK